jgi:hypothetical protein
MSITYHNASGGTQALYTGALTWAHTVPVGLQYGILIVGVELWDTAGANNQVNSITYAGQNLTLRRRSAYSGGGCPNRVEVWYLLNPPTGANNVVVTLSEAFPLRANAITLSGVDQSTPFSTDTEANGTAAAGPYGTSVTIASNPGELVVDFTGTNNYNNTNPTMTVGAGQTSLQETEGGAGTIFCSIGSSSEPGAISNTMTWTATATGQGRWVAIALALRPFIITSARAIKYILDVSDGNVTLRDDQGAIVDPWDVEPDEWMNLNIPDLPTGVETDSFVDDPKKIYIEEAEYDDASGTLSIRTNRGQLLNVIMARLSGGGTI